MLSTAVGLTWKSRPIVGRATLTIVDVHDGHEHGGDEDDADRYLLADARGHSFLSPQLGPRSGSGTRLFLPGYKVMRRTGNSGRGPRSRLSGSLPGGQGGQQFVADVRGGDAGDLGVVVGGRDLHDVGADQVQRAKDRSVASSSRLVRPPASGVPVPGACAGSSTSISTET